VSTEITFPRVSIAFLLDKEGEKYFATNIVLKSRHGILYFEYHPKDEELEQRYQEVTRKIEKNKLADIVDYWKKQNRK
jgi:hypothetical protein